MYLCCLNIKYHLPSSTTTAHCQYELADDFQFLRFRLRQKSLGIYRGEHNITVIFLLLVPRSPSRLKWCRLLACLSRGYWLGLPLPSRSSLSYLTRDDLTGGSSVFGFFILRLVVALHLKEQDLFAGRITSLGFISCSTLICYLFRVTSV